MRLTVLEVFYLFLTLCLSFSCAQNHFIKPCIDVDGKVYTENLIDLEKVADEFANREHRPITATVKVLDQCYKKTFLKNGYQVVIFKNPADDSNGSLTVSFTRAVNETVKPKNCFENALKWAHSVHQPFVESILNEYKKSFPELWEDSELGPGKWLSCKGPMHLEFVQSIGVMLHEMTHELNSECLFSPYRADSKKFCLEFSPELSKLTLSTVAIPTGLNANETEEIRDFAQVYMTHKQSLSGIFNELNSYIVGQKFVFAASKKEPLVFSPNLVSSRTDPMLPIALYYALEYLNALQQLDHDLYLKTFGPETQNRKSILEMLRYGGDLASAASRGSTNSIYLKLRKDLNLLCNKLGIFRDSKISGSDFF